MRAFRFIHCADLHLDSPFRGIDEVPAAVAEQIRQSTFQAFDRLVQTALAERVQAVIIAGDVYDLADRSLRAQLHVQAGFERLAEAGIQVFATHGNHDPADGKRARLALPDRVHVFSHQEVERLPLTDSSGRLLAEISGWSYPTAAVRDNLARRYVPGSRDVWQIAVLHANLDGEDEHDNYAPCTLRELTDSAYDYWALGHIHAGSVRHQYPHVVYSGNIQGRHIRECGPKGCYVVEAGEDRSLRLFFRETDVLRWHRLRLPIEDLREEQAILDLLTEELGHIAQESPARSHVVRIEWTGRGPAHRLLADEAFRADLLQRFRERAEADAESGDPFLWVESARVETGLPIPLDELRAEDSFVGDLMRQVDHLLADDDRLRAFAAEAWGPLLTNLSAARLLKGELQDARDRLLRSARELAADALIGEED